MNDQVEQLTPVCGTCMHFRRTPQAIGAGVCVCMPPAVVPVMQGGVPSVMPVRVPVRSSDSCGQWAEPPLPQMVAQQRERLLNGAEPNIPSEQSPNG